MTDVAYIVRCQRCGVARKSYNDPRRGISVIECKRPCGNSHYDWMLVRIIPATEVWPPAPPEVSDIPLYAPPSRPPSSTQEGDARPSTANPRSEREQNTKEKIQFKSKGKDVVMRSRFASTGGGMVPKAASLRATEGRGTEPHETAANGCRNKEKGDCFVQ